MLRLRPGSRKQSLILHKHLIWCYPSFPCPMNLPTPSSLTKEKLGTGVSDWKKTVSIPQKHTALSSSTHTTSLWRTDVRSHAHTFTYVHTYTQDTHTNTPHKHTYTHTTHTHTCTHTSKFRVGGVTLTSDEWSVCYNNFKRMNPLLDISSQFCRRVWHTTHIVPYNVMVAVFILSTCSVKTCSVKTYFRGHTFPEKKTTDFCGSRCISRFFDLWDSVICHKNVYEST